MNSGIDKRVATHTSHIILEDLSRLPIGTEPTYLAEGMVGLCTGGSAVIELFDYSSRVYCDDMVVILPLQFASLHDRSADFSMRFFKVDRVLFMDIMSGVCRISTSICGNISVSILRKTKCGVIIYGAIR